MTATELPEVTLEEQARLEELYAAFAAAHERSTPVGPWLVTDAESGEMTCEVDGDVVQKADTADLVFSPADLIAYISQLITLVPGDIIATGTPGGVGHARKPPRYLGEGSSLVTRIEGVGELHNTCVKGD